ncbi:hypothetical protein GCM10028808_74800 [Spirosoma migulaei]
MSAVNAKQRLLFFLFITKATSPSLKSFAKFGGNTMNGMLSESTYLFGSAYFFESSSNAVFEM